jgi:hypothetical protein
LSDIRVDRLVDLTVADNTTTKTLTIDDGVG